MTTTFTANYDASGSEDGAGPLICVGLVATETKWLRFENRWREVLRVYNVPYFHLKELNDRHRASKPGRPKNVYAKWANDHETPAYFISDLIGVIKRSINKFFATAVVLDDYRAINNKYRLKERIGSPYSLCASHAVSNVEKWIKPRDKVLHIVESGDCGQRPFLRRFDGTRISVVPKDKIDKKTGEWFLPFQAADLIAGHYRRAAVMKLEGRPITRYEDYGEAFAAIAFGVPQEAVIFTPISLRQAVLDNGIGSR